MKTKIFFAGLLLSVFFLLTSSYAQEMIPPNHFSTVPQMINYQGKVTDASGNRLNGSFQMTFRIYDVAAGGASLWNETQAAVSVEDGVFSVLLGSVNPIPFDVFNGGLRYLGVTVGADPEMTPRKEIVSVPYALTSSGRWACDNDSNGYVYIDPGKFDGCSVAYIRLNERRNHNYFEFNAFDEEWGNMIMSWDPGNASGQGLGIHGDSYMAPFDRFVVNSDSMFLGYSIRPGIGGVAGGGDGGGNLFVRGNVGIGTTNPARPLQIKDVMRLEPRSSYPSSPSDGDLCVVGSSGNRHIYCYLNGGWRQLD